MSEINQHLPDMDPELMRTITPVDGVDHTSETHHPNRLKRIARGIGKIVGGAAAVVGGAVAFSDAFYAANEGAQTISETGATALIVAAAGSLVFAATYEEPASSPHEQSIDQSVSSGE